MVKNKIEYQYNCFYNIIAISTPLKDYRVSYYINDAINTNLIKLENLIVDLKSKKVRYSYDQHADNESNEENEFVLIKNKTIGSFFIPSLKNFDFLLIIKSEKEDINLDFYYNALKVVDHFQIVHKVTSLNRNENKIIENNVTYKTLEEK